MQTCATSSTRTDIEFNFYNNGSSANPFVLSNVLFDTSMNKFLFYSFNGSDQNLHVSKIHSNGTTAWSYEYPDLLIRNQFNFATISGDDSTLRLLGSESNDRWQIIQISAGKYSSYILVR